jgi:hypothetical protein
VTVQFLDCIMLWFQTKWAVLCCESRQNGLCAIEFFIQRFFTHNEGWYVYGQLLQHLSTPVYNIGATKYILYHVLYIATTANLGRLVGSDSQEKVLLHRVCIMKCHWFKKSLFEDAKGVISKSKDRQYIIGQMMIYKTYT